MNGFISRRVLLAAPAALRASPVVETSGGRVRGYTVGGVQIFRGIPYAGPTEGAGRFLPPSPVLKWAGERDATRTGPRCVQGPGNIFLSPVIGEYFGGGRADRVELAKQEDSEDCLVLNVLTPSVRGKRPVMVYIHGGGFTSGSSALTLFADAFPRENDVVLVGVNHRINVFGYLYLGEWSERYADSGNVGQLDLIAALEWVRANILPVRRRSRKRYRFWRIGRRREDQRAACDAQGARSVSQGDCRERIAAPGKHQGRRRRRGPRGARKARITGEPERRVAACAGGEAAGGFLDSRPCSGRPFDPTPDVGARRTAGSERDSDVDRNLQRRIDALLFA